MNRALSRWLAPAAITALMISSLATAATAIPAAATTAAVTVSAAGAPAGHQPVTVHADPKAARTTISPRGTVSVVRNPAVNFRELAKDLTTQPQAAPRVAPRDRSVTFPSFTANYAGIPGTDPSAATNGTTTLETAGSTIAGYDSSGNQVCATITQSHLLRADENSLETAQVQYDPTSHRFIMLDLVAFPNPSPILYLAVSSSNDPCGTWFSYRITLTGDSDDFNILPSLGQDPHSVLIAFTEATAVDEINPSIDHASVAFAVPKAQLYADSALTSFPLFHVDDVSGLMAVTNAGSPMVTSPADYFIAATPGSPAGRYDLYQMSASGPATFTLQAEFTTTAFQVPGDPDQPFTDVSLSLGFEPWEPAGGIQTPAVYDGSRVWFAHAVRVPNGPATTVQYGFIDTGSNTLQFQRAGGASTSADFNPSIGAGLAPNGVETIWLNWATTDAVQSLPLSPVVATMLYNGGSLPALQGANGTTNVVGGTPTTDNHFSVRSSVAPDPLSASGTCAMTAQQYYRGSDPAPTQVTRVCGPTDVRVPNVAGGTPDQAQAALHAAFLNDASTATTTSCSAAQNHQVVSTTPAIGQLTSIGSDVTVNVCNLDATVPNLRGFDDTSAQDSIRSAGFTVGQITMVSDCGVFANEVSSQDPPPFTTHVRGTPINLEEATGLDRNHKPCVDR